MKLQEFIEKFVQPNTLIRLWYKRTDREGCVAVELGEFVKMEHELIKGKYKDNTVIGVTDILCTWEDYPEAVNLIIERF